MFLKTSSVNVPWNGSVSENETETDVFNIPIQHQSFQNSNLCRCSEQKRNKRTQFVHKALPRTKKPPATLRFFIKDY